ncbi:uncharacterized protein LOC118354328 isoform X2 [Canis lupus dingo]|uniref:uncharacterized protein LOC118354328 isoform X2 n=1 Tax=Canis lupus dingo TaxID=286419 RepID=UPI0020C3EB4C|nr:uncharacterized protein LOC118354328 isoform X2 [Canis lupus dingo]
MANWFFLKVIRVNSTRISLTKANHMGMLPSKEQGSVILFAQKEANPNLPDATCICFFMTRKQGLQQKRAVKGIPKMKKGSHRGQLAAEPESKSRWRNLRKNFLGKKWSRNHITVAGMEEDLSECFLGRWIGGWMGAKSKQLCAFLYQHPTQLLGHRQTSEEVQKEFGLVALNSRPNRFYKEWGGRGIKLPTCS